MTSKATFYGFTAVVSLALAQLVLCGTPHISVTANTPKKDSRGRVALKIEKLDDVAWLKKGSQGVFWGYIGPKDVKKACADLRNSHALYVEVHGAASKTIKTTLKFQDVRGCTGAKAPLGAAAGWVDSDGDKAVLVCRPHDTYASGRGCAVYLTGENVILYARHQLSAFHSSGRKLLETTHVLNLTRTKLQEPAASDARVQPVLFPSSNNVEGPLAAIGHQARRALQQDCSPLNPNVCQDCPNACSSGCFPGAATVQLQGGRAVPMHELRLGDEVAVRRPDGSLGFDAVYAWGHKDAATLAPYVRLQLSTPNAVGNSNQSMPTLELSARHFVLAVDGMTGGILHKRAEAVVVGDQLWVAPTASGAKTELHTVTSISMVARQGLFNPYTLGGNIVVDGVVASAHSDWFADEAADKLQLTPYLPAFYQAVLAPVRMVWYVLGKQQYVDMYDRLDQEFDFTNMLYLSNTGGSAAALYVAVLARTASAVVNRIFAELFAVVVVMAASPVKYVSSAFALVLIRQGAKLLNGHRLEAL